MEEGRKNAPEPDTARARLVRTANGTRNLVNSPATESASVRARMPKSLRWVVEAAETAGPAARMRQSLVSAENTGQNVVTGHGWPGFVRQADTDDQPPVAFRCAAVGWTRAVRRHLKSEVTSRTTSRLGEHAPIHTFRLTHVPPSPSPAARSTTPRGLFHCLISTCAQHRRFAPAVS
jgi:hypothetical protein